MKKQTKKISARTHHKVKAEETHVDKEPDYMVQITDPKMIRKDLLESLREIIIFMQGYEKFRKIQEEKVALFSALKTDVKELHSLVENRLKKYLPQGKLRGFVHPMDMPEEREEAKVEVVTVEEPAKKAMVKEERKAPPSELDELESQLKDIESQLRNIQ